METKECSCPMDKFQVADSDGGMYCTVHHPELFGGSA
jgi:hypothetical protein